MRSSFEFAYRMPLIKFKEMYSEYAPEKANRFFDTLMVQKGTAKLLLDFCTAFLQVGLGIILLVLYHSFFMVIGLLFIVILYVIFKFSYKDGLETSLNESKFKYKVAKHGFKKLPAIEKASAEKELLNMHWTEMMAM